MWENELISMKIIEYNSSILKSSKDSNKRMARKSLLLFLLFYICTKKSKRYCRLTYAIFKETSIPLLSNHKFNWNMIMCKENAL